MIISDDDTVPLVPPSNNGDTVPLVPPSFNNGADTTWTSK